MFELFPKRMIDQESVFNSSILGDSSGSKKGLRLFLVWYTVRSQNHFWRSVVYGTSTGGLLIQNLAVNKFHANLWFVEVEFVCTPACQGHIQ